MLRIHHRTVDSSESEAAEGLARLARKHYPDIDASHSIILEIFPSVQCFGQKVQDIDLLVFFADYRPIDCVSKSSSSSIIHSFCVSIEVKGHSPEEVAFSGANCTVMYNGQPHDVTGQSEKQKYSVKKYIEKNSNNNKSPWVSNLIWLTRVPKVCLPKIHSNLLGGDISWQDFIDSIGLVARTSSSGLVETFSNRNWLFNITAIFSKQLQMSKIDRKRLEAITKIKLEGRQYIEKLGQQLLIVRGLGGTGKTVQLISIAFKAYNEKGLRVLFLTYNKALVADIRRLLALSGIKDAIGAGSIAVKTIHGFMHDWLVALGIIKQNQNDFLEKYERYKLEALRFLNAEAITNEDLVEAKAKASRLLSWDLVLVDESQDWPETERDFIYNLYGYKRVIIADGINQFVRGVSRIDWLQNIDTTERQFIRLYKSLRLKTTLCETVGHFANLLDIDNWDLEPELETYGGKFIVVEGNPFNLEFHKRIAATAKNDGNREIDILLCVPPTWVNNKGMGKESIVAKQYRDWGLKVWDGVDPDTRSTFPTDLSQYRIVQYESCRGLEGWVVVNFAFDEFYEYKVSNAEIGDEERNDLFFEENAASEDYAKKWLMIPLTRAIDTMIVHISNRESFVGKKLCELKENYPDDVQWINYT